MKINKKTSEYSKSAMDILVQVGGVAAGAFLSGAAYEAIKNTADTSTVNLVKRGGIAVAGAAGAMTIGSNDELSTFLKSAGVGMAIRQVFDGSKEALATSATATKLVGGNKLQKAIAGGIGLACPCDNTYTVEMQPLRRPAMKKYMNGPTIAALGAPDYSTMSLDAAFAMGKSLSAA